MSGFTFKQFHIDQDQCAMKVGTDGVLLGAWTEAPLKEGRILDIGTGTGLIALMMAQRFPLAQIHAIDVDKSASIQAKQNFEHSPWAKRLHSYWAEAQSFCYPMGFHLIISNPPYFINSLQTGEQTQTITRLNGQEEITQRNKARHTDSLSQDELVTSVERLLLPNGLFSVILPIEEGELLIQKTREHDLQLSRKTTFFSSIDCPKRVLIEFTKGGKQKEVKDNPILFGDHQYQQMVQDFYLR